VSLGNHLVHVIHDYLAQPDPAGTDPVAPLFQDDGTFGAGAAGTASTAPLSQVLYLQERGDTAKISVSDLHQGQLGDCFLISSIGELALTHPTAISNMIQTNSNGTETVRLYEAANGRLPTFGTTAYKAVSVTVNDTFPSYAVSGAAGQDVVGTQKEIWPQVIEKAVATEDGGYGGIAYGGNPMIAMEELTGHAASFLSPASLTLATLQGDAAAGDLIVMDTASKSNLPYNLVGNHAYMFEAVTNTASGPMVQLGNPWGFDQPAAIPLSQLSKGVVEVDVGRFA
jgi:hypothetical protein